MATELGTLLRGDHGELERALKAMLSSTSTDSERSSALDGFRLGFAAHADAEATVLRAQLDRAGAPSAVYFLVAQTVAAHLSQEAALAQLVATRPGTPEWRDAASFLRELIRHHVDHEDACVLPALRDYLDPADYARLAGAYATERLRALTELAPASATVAPLMRL